MRSNEEIKNRIDDWKSSKDENLKNAIRAELSWVLTDSEDTKLKNKCECNHNKGLINGYCLGNVPRVSDSKGFIFGD